jgi:hypothetical protein
MKLIKYLPLILIVACTKKETVSFEGFRVLAAEQKAERIIVISCIRCGCVIDEMNLILRKDATAFNNYLVLADSNCTQHFIKPVPFRHIPQSRLDSISMDFYNLLIINGPAKEVKLLTTEDSQHLGGYIR